MGQVAGIVVSCEQGCRHVQRYIVQVFVSLCPQPADAVVNPEVRLPASPGRRRFEADDGGMGIYAAYAPDKFCIPFDKIIFLRDAAASVRIYIVRCWKAGLAVNEIIGSCAEDNGIGGELLRIPQQFPAVYVRIQNSFVAVGGMNAVIGLDFIPVMDEALAGYAKHAVIRI